MNFTKESKMEILTESYLINSSHLVGLPTLKEMLMEYFFKLLLLKKSNFFLIIKKMRVFTPEDYVPIFK